MKWNDITKSAKASLLWACGILSPLPWGVVVGGLASCSDMMDIDNTRVVYEDQHRIDNPNDSIYSVMGIVAQLQQVADRVVLMGELRGDLMTVDPLVANTDLQDINGLRLTSSNQYADARDFYAIINNCNYILNHIDTTIVEGQTRVMLPEYAQVKTLRAWTYWQLALIRGRVAWFEQPLTDANTETSALAQTDIDDLSQLLIADLLPIAGARPLGYGIVDGWNSSEFFFPALMLLGDLYLYNNMYTEAAQAYYDLISSRRLTVSQGYATTWQSTDRQAINGGHLTAYRDEVVCRLVFDSDLRSRHSLLRRLTYSDHPSLLPAATFADWMQQRTHFHTGNGIGISGYFEGDLRGCAQYATGRLGADAFGPADRRQLDTADDRMLITKFYNNLTGSTTDPLERRPMTSVALLRPTTVYLRYAEAINRAGYPSTAFAVLKYGLNGRNLNDTLRVDSTEARHLPAWIGFDNSAFNGNVGTVARGCGMGVEFDKAQYVIPAEADTVDFVERAILDELAAETCFEGNRFFDLLCVSRHRPGHPRFMAEQVAGKHDDPAAALARLSQMSAWFVGE